MSETSVRPDPVMTEIGRGMELGQRGERDAAREVFAGVWDRLGADGDPFHICALAHSMADVQDDPREELVWDLRALEAADLVSDERARLAGVASPVAAFYPSLHLNLGDVYRRLGEWDLARAHLERGLDAVGTLDDNGYGQLIKGGLDRLAQRLAERSGEPLSVPPSEPLSEPPSEMTEVNGPASA
ncbi:tetratricopeptide repeat protein [Streptomyces niveus]|uniref:tetratricopeptide repeat protein n=1 Tax=Streptomyces niveus TaxID=193462 RepID=UPI00344A2882|nr:tetratricopeptide repeat protein [Streptomyces niveus]